MQKRWKNWDATSTPCALAARAFGDMSQAAKLSSSLVAIHRLSHKRRPALQQTLPRPPSKVGPGFIIEESPTFSRTLAARPF
eukprot:2797003-Amphidinium_carterae.1